MCEMIVRFHCSVCMSSVCRFGDFQICHHHNIMCCNVFVCKPYNIASQITKLPIFGLEKMSDSGMRSWPAFGVRFTQNGWSFLRPNWWKSKLFLHDFRIKRWTNLWKIFLAKYSFSGRIREVPLYGGPHGGPQLEDQ